MKKNKENKKVTSNQIVGTNTLENTVNAIISHINRHYSAELGADFETELDEQKIFFAVTVSERADAFFMKDVYSREGMLPTLSNFLWSILHEVGHLQTADEMEDDSNKREKIRKMWKRNPERAAMRYYALHNESVATDWAVDFAINHTMLCRIWDKALLCALQQFLKANEVE